MGPARGEREGKREGQTRQRTFKEKTPAARLTPLPPRDPRGYFSRTASFQSLWKREGAPAVCEAASQTLRLYASLSSGYSKPTGDKLPPPPRAPTPQPSATAGLGGQGGNDVMLF